MNLKKCLYPAVLLLLFGVAARAEKPAATFRDVAYGPLERNVLDFWRAESAGPAPLVIFIHGGGFLHGGKDLADGDEIRKCLAAGVSFASINYPYYNEVPLQGILRDNIARAVQFLRYKAPEWNIDRTRLAVYGESAGAGSSLWLAAHGDLADPGSPDPVLRESSRVSSAGCLNTQATYDLPSWFRIFDGIIDRATLKAWRLILTRTMLDMYHLRNEKELRTEETVAMRNDLDMLALMDGGDPPVYMKTLMSRLNGGDPLHHVMHPEAVMAKCGEAGMECVLIVDETPEEKRVEVIDFLLEHLK